MYIPTSILAWAAREAGSSARPRACRHRSSTSHCRCRACPTGSSPSSAASGSAPATSRDTFEFPATKEIHVSPGNGISWFKVQMIADYIWQNCQNNSDARAHWNSCYSATRLPGVLLQLVAVLAHLLGHVLRDVDVGPAQLKGRRFSWGMIHAII